MHPRHVRAKPAVFWENLFDIMPPKPRRATAGDAHPSPSLAKTAAFGSNPGGLRMWSFIPQDLPARAPLVVVLHGCGQSASAYAIGAGWCALAERLGFAVLAPEQTAANNMNTCFNWFQPEDTTRDSGEAASIRQMIDATLETHRLDPARVFVTGLSAGGAMTSVMLAAYPEIFAGGAIVAGLPYGAASNLSEALRSMRKGPLHGARASGDLVRAASTHKGPWPKLSIWHGDRDTTVSHDNADALVAQWLDVHDLAPAPTHQDHINGFPRRAWSDRYGETLVECYTILGMAHGTPIVSGESHEACGAPGAFILEAGISSSFHIAEFWNLTRAAAPSTKAPRTPSAKPPLAKSVQDVIAKALKAAGLLKTG